MIGEGSVGLGDWGSVIKRGCDFFYGLKGFGVVFLLLVIFYLVICD